MITVVKKHPLAIRWNHWINFPILTIMIWSGLLIYWANDAYFIPGSWLQALGMGQRLGEGMSWHFPFAVLFALNGFSYGMFLLFSGQWRYLKYNGAQRFAYSAMFLLGAAALVTGLAIYKPVQLNGLVSLLGGYEAARLEHFLITIAFVLFFIVHIIQVVRAGWNNFRAMVTGVEKRND